MCLGVSWIQSCLRKVFEDWQDAGDLIFLNSQERMLERGEIGFRWFHGPWDACVHSANEYEPAGIALCGKVSNGLECRTANGLGRLLPSTLERYRSSAMTSLLPAESPDITMFDAELTMVNNWRL